MPRSSLAPAAGAAPAAVRGRAGSPAPLPPAEPAALRTKDAARTMAGILEVARQEFAEKGLAGARIDEIASATQTSKRMIYYYFDSKEGLYLRVLEEAYRRTREFEATLRLDEFEPREALRRLVVATFDHHQGHQEDVRLVMSENMARGAYLAQSKTIRQLNAPAIHAVAAIYQRGLAGGVFRAGLDPVEIHASISALTFFNVSNQHTFGLLYRRDTQATTALQTRRESIADMVLRYVST